MCGISGIVDKTGRPVSQERIAAINSLIRHRGPDDEGFRLDGNVALGHRRLSIVDLSELGHQPMCWQDRYWIVFNGEIYNYVELRKELQELGHRFRSATDTEVILAAYSQWGPACLSRFNGMWAFAILDTKERKVFLARDRFGVKPLYLMEDGDTFAFGSEIKQLLSLQRHRRAHRSTVIGWMLTRIDGHTEDTFFEGIRSFPQSHWGIYDLRTNSLEVRRWYTLAADSRALDLNDESSVSAFRSAFEDAVRLRLRSDVRVGTCLSGGLDSSATSAFASRMYHPASGDRFIGIHARASEQKVDESPYAREVAAKMGMELHVVQPTPQDFADTIDEVVYTQEEPFGSPSIFMSWQVSRMARQLGCPVMLNGQGGDEVLLGYERYYAPYLRSLPPWRLMQEVLLPARNSRLSLTQLLGYLFYFTNAPLRIRHLRRRTMLSHEAIATHDFSEIRDTARSSRRIDEMQIREITCQQLPHLLRYEDRNSMRHSIESRLPFLDYRVVELGVSLRAAVKIRDGWTKWVLRKAIEGVVPDSITWRRDKLGFQAPEASWLAHHAQRMLEEVGDSRILREIAPRDRLLAAYPTLSLRDRWMYFNIAAWERVYGVEW